MLFDPEEGRARKQTSSFCQFYFLQKWHECMVSLCPPTLSIVEYEDLCTEVSNSAKLVNVQSVKQFAITIVNDFLEFIVCFSSLALFR